MLKAQERKLRLAKLKSELVERDRAVTLVLRLARQERDAWGDLAGASILRLDHQA